MFVCIVVQISKASFDLFQIIFSLSLHTDYPYLETNNKAQDWSLEEGYATGTPIETYPHRGSVSNSYHEAISCHYL